MMRYTILLLAALTLFPQEGLAQIGATVGPDGVGGEVVVPIYLNAGGSYLPAASGASDAFYEAPSTDFPVAAPSLEWHFEAAAWASDGQEVAAFVHADVLFSAAPGAMYLNPPPQSGTMSFSGYSAPCDPTTHNHCDCTFPTNCMYETFAYARVNRLYRVVNTTMNSLPPDEDFVPLLVDYAHHRRFNIPLPLPEPQGLFSVVSTVKISYPRPGGGSPISEEVRCSRETCANGEALSGTLEFFVPVDSLDAVSLAVSANVFVNNNPTCQIVDIDDQQLCVVPVYGGGVQVLVDPFVYVDPTWQYASWFEVEASDDNGATWQTTTRTTFDLEAFGVGDNGTNPNGPDGGTPNPNEPDGGTPNPSEPDGGTSDPGVNDDAGAGSGGCAIHAAGYPARPLWQLCIFVSLAILSQRRATRQY